MFHTIYYAPDGEVIAETQHELADLVDELVGGFAEEHSVARVVLQPIGDLAPDMSALKRASRRLADELAEAAPQLQILLTIDDDS